MKISGKAALAMVVGALALGSVVSVTAQEGDEAEVMEAKGAGVRFAGHGPHPRLPIRAEVVLPGRDDGPVTTVRSDRGELTGVDGDTLSIEESDGTTVRVPLDDDTKIRRDGDEASVGDLETGDHVYTVRVKEGDGAFVTRGVMAISAERYAEMEERRRACEQDRESCRPPGFVRGGPHRAPRPADGPGGPLGDAGFEGGEAFLIEEAV